MGIEWAGWRTDTLTLQQNGWEIATDFDIRRLAYTLLLRHKLMRLYAVSDSQVVEQAITDPAFPADRFPIFHIRAVAPSIQTHVVAGYDFSKFREIDATPMVAHNIIQRVEDMNIFAAPMPGSKGELLVDGADMTVIEHLEAIKRLQSDKQMEIRERILRSRDEGSMPDSRPLPKANVIAHLVNYREAA
jgi:hypothetical protein